MAGPFGQEIIEKLFTTWESRSEHFDVQKIE